ncbi:MAG: hypothetical protein HFJ55_00905 [Clostridia bacterium]|jgi:hypothetical protein|nr:hypothetical protein [Clostridia bacterium]
MRRNILYFNYYWKKQTAFKEDIIVKNLFKRSISLLMAIFAMACCGVTAFAVDTDVSSATGNVEVAIPASSNLAQFDGLSYSTVRVNFTVGGNSKVKINYSARPVANNPNFYSYLEIYSANSTSRLPVWTKYNIKGTSNIITTSNLAAGNYYLILGTSETGTATGFAYSGFIYYA